MITLLNFRVQGISPLLMHSPACMFDVAAGGVKTGAKPTAEEDAKRGEYRLPNGILYLPTLNFRASLLEGCKGKKLGKYGARSRMMATAFIVEDTCPLFHSMTNEPITTYEVDVRRVVIQKQGIPRGRPLIREWATIVILECDHDFVSPEQMLLLFNIAGKVAGVGDYRPNKGGWFGRYSVTLENSTEVKDGK